MTVRTGIGYDCHRFAKRRKLILGGIEIDHKYGLEGHSDADVLTHAIIDALLGGAALGDIGQHFPDTDPRYKDADSLLLLEEVVKMLFSKGFTINNIDCTIVLEQPKLSPYREKIVGCLAAKLEIDENCVSVKATTAEGMGFIGREEGIGALALATICSDS